MPQDFFIFILKGLEGTEKVLLERSTTHPGKKRKELENYYI